MALDVVLLALRARRPDAFKGSYDPLDAGPETVAFARGGAVVVALPVRGEPEFSRPPGGWSEVVALAGITVLERRS